ncbi:MAG: hypothetical protein BWK73_51635 [Thiothrix lacustris]|uniref:Uncharacterized protein n=1 Tax=Thiothrix lacustris TaxID=525917 RepID=A0A1Y1Q7T1_9GAMM|nr:MAG: hypothetical protein BWK73_51635 [Thiothrix lacustris]
MSAPLNNFLLLSLGGGVLVAPVMANDPPPLQQKLEALHCATDAKVAKKILSELHHINAPGQQWPDEWLGQKPEPSLHAALLDIALHTLKTTAERFPDLREEAERIALQWDYCEVMENQNFHDLILRQQKLHKQLTGEDAPLKWQGFKEWGFLTPDPADRFVPKLLDEIRIAPNAYHLFLHQAYRERCFPHPETGQVVREAETPPAAVANQALPFQMVAEATAQPYPFKWNPACQVSHPVAAAKVADRAVDMPKTAQKTGKPTLTTNKTERKQQRDARQEARQQHQQQRVLAPRAQGISGSVGKVNVTPPTLAQPAKAATHPAKVVTPSAKLAPRTVAAKKPTVTPKREPQPIKETVYTTAKGEVILPTIVSTTAGGDIPIYFEDAPQPQAHSTTGIIDAKKKKRRIAVTVADTVSLKDGSNNVAVSASWSPKKDWFVNGSASVKDGEPGYAWNVGYANPKPGTVSVQVGHNGPIKAGQGLDVKNASASIGYKVNSAKLAKRKISASGSVNISAKGKAKASATMQWNPKPNVNVRTTATVPVDGGKPSWSYSAGYSSPKKGGVRVEYSNYGNNDFPGDNLKDGAITVSKGWQF